MDDAPTPTRARALGPALVRSPVLWVAAAVCLVASPALFLSTLVLGAVIAAVGVAVWASSRRAWPLALGVGMVVGSLPYTTAGLVRLIS